MTSANPLPSLTDATTGNGTVVDFDVARKTISMMVVPSGTVATGQVRCELSQDGTSWWAAGTTATVATGVVQAVNAHGVAFRYARAVVAVNVTGGGSVTVTFMESDT